MWQNCNIMRYRELSTDDAVLGELGKRLRRTRLEANLSQDQVAEQSGVSRYTIRRIEDGHSVQLNNLIRVLRFLGLLDGLEELVPEVLTSPIDAVRRGGRRRRRASGPRSAGEMPQEPEPWQWADRVDEDEQ
jgi:transcriptional regulator with XRE-family HTH domain